MAVLPVNLARVSNQLKSNISLNQINLTQAKLARVQNQLTTGRQLNSPSENPADANIAAGLRKTLEQRQTFAANLDASKNTLDSVDGSLGDISGLLQQAQTLASANVGDDSTQDQKNAAATQIDSIYSQLIDLGNKQFEGSYLFAGDKLDAPPFVQDAAGVTFVGSERTLKNQVDESTDASFQVDGAEVFGALSTRIVSNSSLVPSVEDSTRLNFLGGASGNGIRRGVITVGNGTDNVKVDLTNADTLGDVAASINNANLAGVTASVGPTGLTLTPAGSEAITVTDAAGGFTAADLGILAKTSPGPGADVVGVSTNPQMSALTPLVSLNNGAGIDLAGLQISNGGKSATVDLTGAVSVQDLLNAVNASGTGVRMDITPDGTGLRLLNTTQGTDLTVSENGGTTATDLGLRSLTADAKLVDLNHGDGVRTMDGVDFTITDSSGAESDIDLTDADKTVQDVIDKINASGAGVTAGFATTGNGIVLTDTAGGGGTLKVTAKNASNAAEDLGLDAEAVGNVVTGRDVHPVAAQGVFANVDTLRQALRKGDRAAITKAAEALQADYDRVVHNRGEVGARLQAVESRTDRIDQENVATKALLSKLEDTDFTKAATEYSLLQTSLQAAMETTSKMLNLSLMDFIR